jgi:hypothetical protein
MRPAASSGSSSAEQPSVHRRGSATLSVVLAGAIVLLALAGGLTQSLLPDTLVGRDAPSVVAAVIFTASYLALAVGRIPGLARRDRADSRSSTPSCRHADELIAGRDRHATVNRSARSAQ